MFKKLFFASLFILFIFNLQAKDIYVKAGATGQGSQEQPYGSVSDALNAAFAGDVIHVAGGDYFGPGASGLFMIEKPDLTLVGGYNSDFSQRNPFVNITRLMQGAPLGGEGCSISARCKTLVETQKIPETKATINVKGIIVGGANHKNFIMDGFVIDGFTRYAYKINDDLNTSSGPVNTACVTFNQKGVKFRNNVVVNCAGPAINIQAVGTKLPKGDQKSSGQDWPEVTNNIFVNTMRYSIDLRVGNMSQTNPDQGAILVKNNTMAFNWPARGGQINVLWGKQTRMTLEDNIISFSGYALDNRLWNKKARLKGNVFFGYSQGLYKYSDRPNSTLVMDDPAALAGAQCKEKYMCSKQSQGNVKQDPQFSSLDKFVLDKFFNQIASSGGGKVSMDIMNKWRQAHGMNLQGSKGSGKQNYFPIWDIGEAGKGIQLFSKALPAKGVQAKGLGGSFEKYQSQSVAKKKKDYQEIKFDQIKRNAALAKQVSSDASGKGKDVQVSLKIGTEKATYWYLPKDLGVNREAGYKVFADKTSNVYLYFKSGSPEEKYILQAQKEGIDITLKGSIYALVGPALSGRVGLVVDEAIVDDED